MKRTKSSGSWLTHPLVIVGALAVVAGVALIAVTGAFSEPETALSEFSAETRQRATAQEFTLHESARPITDLYFEDGSSETVSLADFKGRIVLLNLWATWCAPCKEEMPSLDRLQAQLENDGLAVVALSVDETLEPVRSFFQEHHINHLKIYSDKSGKALTSLSVLGVPTTLVIDRRGRELMRLIGVKDWDSPEVVGLIQNLIVETRGES